MPLSESPDLSDVVNTDYKTASVAVGTTQVEGKVGASPLVKRQILTLHNKGPNTFFYGPSGVTASTGTPIVKNQFACLATGDCVSVFMICDTGNSATVIVQEYS